MISSITKIGNGELHQGDVIERLSQMAPQSVHTCVTSPPYWNLRDYGVDGQIGLEKTPQEYVEKMVDVFRAVWPVLRDDGTVWLNMGDSYAGSMKGYMGNGKWADRSTVKQGTNEGSLGIPPTNPKDIGLKPKDLCGIPWRLALALQDDGWYLRSDIIWHKPNPMPESVTDRPTKSHEYLFLLSKKQKYYYDHEAIKEPVTGNAHAGRKDEQLSPKYGKNDMGGHNNRAGTYRNYYQPDSRNKRTVWTVVTKGYPEAHFATFPPDLIKPCILAGCPVQGTVLDPFMGSGTTAIVAQQNDRRWVGIELSKEYCKMAERRILKEAGQHSQMQMEGGIT